MIYFHRNELTQRGAFPCVDLFTYEEVTRLWENFHIFTKVQK
jgi:hypothetical protein